MRFSHLVWIVFSSIIFIGCQKEYSRETDANPTPAKEGLLIAASLKDAGSDVTFTYEYNAANLPSRNLFLAKAGGLTINGITQVTRDAAGKVTFSRIVLTSNISAGSDTLNYEIKRNANGKIGYVLLKPADTANTVGYDSIVYSYNAGSKLSGYVVYLIEYGTGIVEPMQAFEITYNGNNVVKLFEYELLGAVTNRQLVETITFFYDNKPAARVVTEDDFIANLAPINNICPAVNNTLKYSREYAQDPDENVITEYKYVYGNNGKPISADVTTIRPGLADSKATLTFTYR
jgi:hypothetical protein